MTKAECEKLKRGTMAYIYEGNGWRQKIKFLKLVEVISWGRMTIGQVINHEVDWSKGKPKIMAECLTDKNELIHVDLRKLHKA